MHSWQTVNWENNEMNHCKLVRGRSHYIYRKLSLHSLLVELTKSASTGQTPQKSRVPHCSFNPKQTSPALSSANRKKKNCNQLAWDPAIMLLNGHHRNRVRWCRRLRTELNGVAMVCALFYYICCPPHVWIAAFVSAPASTVSVRVLVLAWNIFRMLRQGDANSWKMSKKCFVRSR